MSALLAKRLDELAAANSQGLIDDEEYRLLRQDIFQRSMGGPSSTSLILMPSEVPVVPAVAQSPRAAALSSTQWGRTGYLPEPFVPPSQTARPSISSGVANLIRRATGRRKDVTATSASSPEGNRTGNSLKRAFIPRMLSRKPSVDMTSIRTTSSGISSSRKEGSSGTSDIIFSPPTSPARSSPRVTPPLGPAQVIPMNDDIFEDGGLNTTIELRQAIAEIQMEGKRVVEAFDGLERSAVLRLRQRSDHDRNRNRPSTASATMLEAKSPLERSRSDSTAPDTHSVKSNRSNVSMRSKNSRRPMSPLSARPTGSPIPILQRKTSSSSVSSAGKTARVAFSNTARPNFSRSTGHLPLRVAEERAAIDGDKDIIDIRRRRLEVIARYEARLEYLKARLKGAELHEKLLRR